MTDADGGFGRARDFLIHQLQTELLPNWQAGRAGRALADKYGLDFMVYEGGTLLLNGDGTENPDLTDFAIRFSQSVELKAVYEAELAAWATVGTGPFAWYCDLGRGGPWGDYGHWKGPEFTPQPRADAITEGNKTVPPWWVGDDRPASALDNGSYAAGTDQAEVMRGTALRDRLYALGGQDVLIGRLGADRLWAGEGADAVRGGGGADEINGGGGADTLRGGSGPDRFLYQLASQGGDSIADFTSGSDRFVFLREGFGNHAAGRLAVGEFQSSDADQAMAANIRVFYDRDDHRLYYDQDGSGVAAAVLIAVLQVGAIVTAEDILFW